MPKATIASSQFALKPVEKFEDFELQLLSSIKAGKEQGADLLLLPEYFSINLIGLLDDTKDEAKLFRELATYSPRVVEFCVAQAKAHSLYIVAGSLPTLGNTGKNTLYNEAFICSPDGQFMSQGKLNLTSWERDNLKMSPLSGLRVFDTELGRLCINICYDIEFPEIARAATDKNAQIILVPSWTDDFQGFTRVRVCARARCVENHIYVVQASMIGCLEREPAINPIYGQSVFLGPADSQFPPGGIIKEGSHNEPELVVAEIDLDLLSKVREHGATRPVMDRANNGKEIPVAEERI